MNAFFNSAAAASNTTGVSRVFLWQHRGSASTEWLLENANCEKKSDTTVRSFDGQFGF